MIFCVFIIFTFRCAYRIRKGVFNMKRIIILILVFTFLFPASVYATEENTVFDTTEAEDYWFEEAAAFTGDFKVKSAYLTDYLTGAVLYAKNEQERLPIASVTKIMTSLLVFEALEAEKISYEETVTVSDHAASMGGSQVYLEPGEQMTVKDLMKAMMISSANDATVALAEHVAGSVETFVSMMNNRAAALGMTNTAFKNPHGLDEEGHYSCAKDVAVMTRELLTHKDVSQFTTVWMDTIRDGAFGLSNTNKLIRYYSGATGMKTGFTNAAGFCLSGTAMRDGLHLIAVVLGGESSNERFGTVKKMLDYGFANYSVFTPEHLKVEDIFVPGGTDNYLSADYTPPSMLTEKGVAGEITQRISVFEDISAPVAKGDKVGRVDVYRDGELIATADLTASEDIQRIGFGELFLRILRTAVGFI
ncbi:MAG: D-alanyl-D-alanine carboxypeptidase [Ruminococcaceae bacterium]|nr:D-alanyl-D-alanine carboxypeptidase [Oscillospiraceae bacterium]